MFSVSSGKAEFRQYALCSGTRTAMREVVPKISERLVEECANKRGWMSLEALKKASVLKEDHAVFD